MADPLQVGFRVREVPNLRGEVGRFTSAGLTEQYARNRRMAEVLRADLGRRIENRIAFGKRPTHSTGRLVRASAASENSVVESFRLGVGVESWLNRSQAKYWRTFEEGSAATWRRPFIGTQLIPVAFDGRSDLRTNMNEFPASGRFVVKREIAPAHIYRELARSANLSEFGIQSARLFLNRVFSEMNSMVAGPGWTPPAV